MNASTIISANEFLCEILAVFMQEIQYMPEYSVKSFVLYNYHNCDDKSGIEFIKIGTKRLIKMNESELENAYELYQKEDRAKFEDYLSTIFKNSATEFLIAKDLKDLEQTKERLKSLEFEISNLQKKIAEKEALLNPLKNK